MSGSREWDAATYSRVSGPQQAWAREQLSRVQLRGDEVVLDAGCGAGNVTEVLAELVPQGKVYGVDASANMAAHAAARLGDRAVILHQDLTELDLPEQVDLVFSNATFHWIHNHGLLFDRLFAALAPGGRLVAQCGGRGNIDRFRRDADAVAATEPFAVHFAGWRNPWNYAGPEETATRLADAGFVDVDCWLQLKPTQLDYPRDFIKSVNLVRHLDPLPEELRDQFVDAVLARCASPLTLDYVRLNMAAGRA